MQLFGFTVAIAILALLGAACSGDSSNASTPAEPSRTKTNAVADPSAAEESAPAAENGGCGAGDPEAEEIDEAKLLFEFNATDDDTGVHGLFDTSGFAELCVFAPDGRQILVLQPQGQLRTLGMGGVFFESREPEGSEVSQDEILADFPPGEYEVAAIGFDGTPIAGTATLTHDLPVPPVVTFPAEGDVVDLTNFIVTWDPVTATVAGDAASISGYEVIVTKEVEDPLGFSQPILSAHVLPSVTSLTIPSEFLEPGIEYELEVIALEESGNQTITIVFFETR